MVIRLEPNRMLVHKAIESCPSVLEETFASVRLLRSTGKRFKKIVSMSRNTLGSGSPELV